MLSATVGVHPHHASDFSRTTNANLENLIREHSNVVVAVGETGLDFNRDFSPRPEQEKAFEAQLELAANTDLPVFLHERDAYQRQYPILKSVRDDIKAGVIHCFTGTRKHLYGYLDLDLYIGITGWVCDPKRGLELRQLISDIPLERLMIETDAPYLLPKTLDTKPKNGRNEPCYLPVVLETIAELRDIPPDELAAVITQNTIQFFDLKGDSPTQPAPSSA
jgi:TatD DNase family protein